MGLISRILNRIRNNRYKVQIERLDTSNDEGSPRDIKRVMNLLNYTKTSAVSYSAGVFDSGYHSFKIKEYEFKGQRNPHLRFKDLPVSLEGQSVLDIGCNQGGMLHAFSDVIRYGIGIDYDSRMINTANKIKSFTASTNLDFYVFNLETEDLNYIRDLLPEDKIDVILLLSVCMWINNWREVIEFSRTISDTMIFESNGKPEQQDEQINFLTSVFEHVDLIHDRSEDDPSQKNRKLLYCY